VGLAQPPQGFGTLLGEGKSALPAYTGANPELVKIQTDQNEALKEAGRIYEQTRTSAETYGNEMAVLNELLKEGRIDQETYSRAAAQAAEKQNQAARDAQKFGQEIGQTIEQAALFGRSWQDAFKTVIIQLSELILKMTVFKGLTDTKSGGGGFFSSLLSGLVGYGGGRAEGGPIESGKWYLAGERGPEPIWGGGPGAFAAGWSDGWSNRKQSGSSVARCRLARKPKLQMRTKPRGSRCKRKRRRNSSTGRVMSRFLLPWVESRQRKVTWPLARATNRRLEIATR
jgi:hypothetical protein